MYMFQPIATENLETFSYQLRCRICTQSGKVKVISHLLKHIEDATKRINSVLLHDTLTVDILNLQSSSILVSVFYFTPRVLYALNI